MLKKIFLITISLFFLFSCGNSPTNPDGGGGTPPSQATFLDILKKIDVVKAGEQEWDLKMVKEDASKNILTVEPRNNAKGGNLEGLKNYFTSKIYSVFSDFKYGVEVDYRDSGTASDGTAGSKANSDPLTIKLIFTDKETGNPVSDPEFRDGKTIKFTANANWVPTPKAGKEDFEASFKKIGNITINGQQGTPFSLNFSDLIVNEPTEGQDYTSTLIIDNTGKKDQIDLITFVETISKANSQTEYLKINYVDINGQNKFRIGFTAINGDKVLYNYSKLILTVVGTDPNNPIFGLRDFKVSISGNPTIETDNSGKEKMAEITVNTDIPYLELHATAVKQASGTPIQGIENIAEYIYGGYASEPQKMSMIGIAGEALAYIHSMLKDGETISLELTLTAYAEGYKEKPGLKLTLNIKKGKSLPEVTLNDFNDWLNSINVQGFTKQAQNGALTLTASSDTTPNTALNLIKDSLVKLKKDKIVIDEHNIEQLSWYTYDSFQYPSGNNDGALRVNVVPSDNYVFSDEVKQIIENQTGPSGFMIIVKPNKSWIPDIAIDGAGSSVSNPLEIKLGDGEQISEFTYKIKLPRNISSIEVSELKQAEGISDNWNILSQNLSIFESYNNSTVLKIDNSNVKDILENTSIAKDSSQIYKVTLKVSYSVNQYVTEEIDLYVKLVKDYYIADVNYISKALVKAFYNQDNLVNITVKISDSVTLQNVKAFYDYAYYNYFTLKGTADGQGSISYLNASFNTQDTINRIKKELAATGIEWTGNSLKFVESYDSEDENIYEEESAIATISKDQIKVLEKYILKNVMGDLVDPAFDDLKVEIRNTGKTWLQ